ncbi:flagellar biosynthesis repressor FlbT [Tropicibacter naphthalenivorans]|uniref:Flagellar biosynthesis repressor FlbT n=1 Tax=Tropicibacter naphthalenivorans TaxID=441103 RepID=A0A0P1GE86_9RHOB|nr:flagellar biosynthesis repressor FlbT [Tropicibacter naphthalenivorans]CUH79727.1 flagellar biosynthesis repressor FlbT [Tropicibacter naphthalenivorans]SMC74796.1 flagellar protein FlbT [Tropicibacter naphthalenivorans]
MSGLVLKLAPRERVLINGAVIENGDRRSRLSIVTPNTNVLRLRDAIHPDEAQTPVRRLCYAAQLILTGDVEPEEARQQLIPRIEELSRILIDPDSRRLLSQASDSLLAGEFYQSLKALRALIPREDRLLATKP